MSSPTVFISYSHDSREHIARVLTFANKLVEDGIDCILDQWESSPPDGWPMWMDKNIRDADFVVMICTETYYRRVMGEEEPGKGFGVRWEGKLIYQHIHDAGTTNERFIPLLFEDGSIEHIPTPLRGPSRYQVDTEQGYEDLYRRLTNQPAAEKPELGKLRVLPPRQPKKDFLLDKISLAKMPTVNPELFGREKELKLLDDAWNSDKTNIVSLVAFGGVGKTALVSNWLKKVRDDNWRGAERVLGWSFYSQGAAEGRQISADQFIAFALDWFGDVDPTKGSPWDKGERLAELVKKQRTLLILDGLEPLQSPTEKGCIKDPGLQCLLKELANQNLGLCIITTRLAVDDLRQFVGGSVEQKDLEELSPEAGAQLLQHLGVSNATNEELEEAATEFGGHALAIELLGRLLAVAFEGDIQQRDKIPALMIEKEKGGHARRVMEWYERLFAGKPELDILYIMGLFDRPAEGGAIKALREKPAIKGLTAKLQNLSDIDWKYALNSLRDARLLGLQDPNDPDTLDCHPLMREHFGEKLQKNNPKAWKEAHSRLYEYYKSVPEKEQPDTIEEMTPLYAAVGHGCRAGRYQEVLDGVYWHRISREREFYAIRRLGAFGAELAALSGFFENQWQEPVKALTDHDRMDVLGWAGFALQALGRLPEAIEPMVTSLNGYKKSKDWKNASNGSDNISQLQLIMGNFEQALTYARQSVEHADRSGNEFWPLGSRITMGNTLHQLGRMQLAETSLKEAEEKQKAMQPVYPLLYSLQGLQYCDLLLSRGRYKEVVKRTKKLFEWQRDSDRPLDIAADYLSAGRAHFIKSQVEQRNNFLEADNYLNKAVDGLRQAAQQDEIPRGLLARAELYRVQKDFHKAKHDLNEAMTIATRGGMRLHEADCHLEYARLYLAKKEKVKARESLETAARMIEEMEYHRRDPEVQLAYAQLHIAEGNKDKAREHLATAQKMIDDMGMHRWDKDAADLAKVLA